MCCKSDTCKFRSSPEEDCRSCAYLQYDRVETKRNKHRTINYYFVGCELGYKVNFKPFKETVKL